MSTKEELGLSDEEWERLQLLAEPRQAYEQRMKQMSEELITWYSDPEFPPSMTLEFIYQGRTYRGVVSRVEPEKQEEPTPTHDGKLEALGDSPYVAQVEFFDARPPTALLLLSGGYGASVQSAVYFDPKQALSLLAWLTQEKPVLEQLAREQE